MTYFHALNWTQNGDFECLVEDNPIFNRIAVHEGFQYRIDRKLLRVLIQQITANFLQLSGTEESVQESTLRFTAELRPSKYLNIKTNDDGKEVFKRDRPELPEAIDYFLRNVGKAFSDALEDLLLEAAFKSIAKKTERGTYILRITEKEFFKRLINARVKVQEERLDARKAVGDKRKWVAERVIQLEEFCKKKRKLILEVKKDYKKCKSFNNWRETIKQKYPELPDNVIANLSAGRDAQPAQLTFEYAAHHFSSSRRTIEGIMYRKR